MVYVIECSKCTREYLGETENSLHTELNGHQLDIQNICQENLIAKSFNFTGHSLEELSIFAIEKMHVHVHREDSNLQKTKESYWNQTLQLLTPEGLNLDP